MATFQAKADIVKWLPGNNIGEKAHALYDLTRAPSLLFRLTRPHIGSSERQCKMTIGTLTVPVDITGLFVPAEAEIVHEQLYHETIVRWFVQMTTVNDNDREMLLIVRNQLVVRESCDNRPSAAVHMFPVDTVKYWVAQVAIGVAVIDPKCYSLVMFIGGKLPDPLAYKLEQFCNQKDAVIDSTQSMARRVMNDICRSDWPYLWAYHLLFFAGCISGRVIWRHHVKISEWLDRFVSELQTVIPLLQCLI